MFIRLRDIKLPIFGTEQDLFSLCADKLKIKRSSIEKSVIFRKSLDARRSENICYIYTVDIWVAKGTKYRLPENAEIIEKEESYKIPTKQLGEKKRPVIIGFGPCGMFCALVLAKAGLRPIVVERGKKIDERVKDVETFFKTGVLSTSSNIQFGEGGAGTFSDGKLNTLVKDREGRGKYVLKELVKSGAPEEILYINKPHVGTDVLRHSMQNIRKEIETLGGSIYFEHELIGIDQINGNISGIRVKSGEIDNYIECDTLFLAIGHSARDTFIMLKNMGIELHRKPFAVGVRIEHKQSTINKAQYKNSACSALPAADYKLVCHTKNGRSVYSFCMCPGGEVVAAASEENMVVTNGMSNFARNGENANAALLVEVHPEDFEGQDPLSGMYFQRSLERKAFECGGGGYCAPAQLVGDFLGNASSNMVGSIKPTYSRGVKFTDLHNVLPQFVTESLEEGLRYFGTIIKGFDNDDAVMTAVESRSSSPIRIVRDSLNLQSTAINGLYPIGEGAGYAGGIMSAAMDGMKAAEKYMEGFENADK